MGGRGGYSQSKSYAAVNFPGKCFPEIRFRIISWLLNPVPDCSVVVTLAFPHSTSQFCIVCARHWDLIGP